MSHSHHGMMPFKGLAHLCRYHQDFIPGRFARLFPKLPPLYLDPNVLHDLGRAGGPMEDKGAANLTKTVPAGQIFFGQFIDHDITLDVTSSLTTTNDPRDIENVRTPTLDLDCIYGDGPEAHPHLYGDGGKLLTGEDYADPIDPNDLARHDLPRTPTGTAIIGDPRNDENRVISQLQLGFLRLHNKVIDALAGEHSGAELFEEARRIVTWHYQWVVLHDFLRAICGDYIVDDILHNGRKIYRPESCGNGDPFIPIEFSVAAYRFGHSMIPPRFRVKVKGKKHDVFGPVLGRGFQPVKSLDEVVEWAALLDDGKGGFERAGKLDAKLAKMLLDLPFMPPSVPPFARSLATRNLLRAQSFLLPSGEQVAGYFIECGVPGVDQAMIDKVRTKAATFGLPKATPLWVYLLLEGRWVGRQGGDGTQFEKGEGLGPVGARLVAEVMIGLMERDPRSFLGVNRSWSPAEEADTLGAKGVDNLYRLLTF